jgi:hypothetical protein
MLERLIRAAAEAAIAGLTPDTPEWAACFGRYMG